MEINEESVNAHIEILTNPKNYGMPFRPIKECFEKSDIVTAKHILAKSYMDNDVPKLHKVLCYIVMDKVFGLCDGKDENGLLGYHLKYVPEQEIGE